MYYHCITDYVNEIDPNAAVLVQVLVPLWFAAAGSPTYESGVLLFLYPQGPWIVVCPESPVPVQLSEHAS